MQQTTCSNNIIHPSVIVQTTSLHTEGLYSSAYFSKTTDACCRLMFTAQDTYIYTLLFIWETVGINKHVCIDH